MALILGIESSCDDTSAAVLHQERLLSNVIGNQDIYQKYGGVVPELASRAHQQNIIPVVEVALKEAGVNKSQIEAVAFTQGPGLLGSLMVGVSFAKGFAMANQVPLIAVNHLHGHILAHFIKEEGVSGQSPVFPFLCLLVSGGHTQLIIVHDYLQFEIIGRTIDDAAGEAFDKCGKVMGLPYPSGPVIDKYARQGNPDAFQFSKPKIAGYDYSFSGLKTSFLYSMRDYVKKEKDFMTHHQYDICASLQKTIVDILMEKLFLAAEKTNITQIALAGGVAANSGLRNRVQEEAKKRNWNTFIPAFKFTTDNAAMIAITGYYKYQAKQFAPLDVNPKARLNF